MEGEGLGGGSGAQGVEGGVRWVGEGGHDNSRLVT